MSLGAIATNERLEGLPLQLFLWVIASGSAISARDIQVFLRMLENRSWCQSRWVRENLHRTRERHASAWNLEALSGMKRDLEQLHAGLRSLREALPASELAAARTDSRRLAEATARASGGILGQGGLRRERRDALLVFTALADSILLSSEERPSPTGAPPVATTPRAAAAPARARRRARCVQVIDETADVRTFRFAPIPRVRFDYLPGQFMTLEVDAEGETLKRSYTIASSPTRPDVLEITVKRVLGGRVSNWLHDNLRVGDEVTLTGPAGKFSCELGSQAEKLLLVSGGSGITPVMSMSRFLYDNADPRDVVFLYSARNEADLIFRDELTLMAARNGHFRTVYTLTNAPAEWRGFRGRISPQLIEDAVPDFRQRTVFLCGPHPFMQTVKGALAAADFPMVNFNAESFGGVRAGAPATGVAAESRVPLERSRRTSQLLGILPRPRFTVLSDRGGNGAAAADSTAAAGAGCSTRGSVVFSTSGREAPCADETILEAAEVVGLSLPSGCRAGVCGTCKLRKISGSVRMDCEDGLDPGDVSAGFILACTARPLDRVVVEA